MSKLDSYFISKVEDFLVILGGGEKFIKLEGKCDEVRFFRNRYTIGMLGSVLCGKEK